MKILKLRFENLNSLTGKWEIDFTHPEYVSNGIFAITGPTGAGKSTILDAICLAIYGMTPRLDKITQSTNEIMSRRTGECYAEVEFETRKGQYRINWSQKRARGKSDGKLQGAKHILYDAEGKAIAEKKRDLDKQVEELTGMDFERFTRSMLLAQGGFAAFLQASPDERAPILEEITGSAIYTQISMLVHEFNRDKRQELDLLKAKISGITLLPEEDEKKLQAEVEELEKNEKTIQKKDKLITDKSNWLILIDKMKNELKALEDESKLSAKEVDAFKPQRTILEKAVKASKIDSEYALLKEKRSNLDKERAGLKANCENLPAVSAELEASKKETITGEAELKKLKVVQKNELELLKKVRALDIQINTQNKAEKELRKKKDQFLKEIESETKKIAQLQKKKEQIVEEQAVVDAYIKEHSEDEKLTTSFEGIKERLNNLASYKKEIENVKISLKKNEQDIKEVVKKLEKEEANQKSAEKEHQEIENDINLKKDEQKTLLAGRLIREYRSDKDAKLREQSYIAKITDLEEERKQLEDGKACPLCGSIHHPFAVGNIPELSKVEKEIIEIDNILKAAETIEKEITEKGKSANFAKERIGKIEKEAALLSQSLTTLKDSLQENKIKVQESSAKFAEIMKTVFGEISIYGYNETALDNSALLLEQLAERVALWHKNRQLQDDFAKQTNEIKADIHTAKTVLKRLNDDLKSCKDEIKTISANIAEFMNERRSLYGDKQPDVEEEKKAKSVMKAEGAAKFAKDKYDKLQLEYKTLQAAIKKQQEEIAKSEPVIEKLANDFLAKCADLNFADEKEFEKALMEPNKLEELANIAETIDKRAANIATKKGEAAKRLKLEEEKQLTDEPIAELQKQQSIVTTELSELREKIGRIRQQLNDNALAGEKIKQSKSEIKKAEAEVLKWQLLHDLIGSADGKKFRNFAQGLTFQIMVSYANKQLKTMTDRYLLVRDKTSPLELNVIDNYQAGEERTTKNLSGGESFIVSLALALGLSNMASRNVSVDSLFLDEGFGTLDEDSLEMALESLSTLQQDNKLIGIISHVGALKERITTQINVNPITGGKSEISGPGCIKI
jgi:exonuclease SbcC